MDTLKISITHQLTGLTFSLAPKVRQSLIKDFPSANPVNNIFVSLTTKSAFEGIYGTIVDYITPALTGLKKEDLDKIKVVYVDPVTDEVVYPKPISSVG